MTTPAGARVALIGTGFMGAIHSQAWRTVGRFFDVAAPTLTVVGGRNPTTTEAFGRRHGWAGSSTDWREIVQRDDVDIVDICTPGDSHAELAIAALRAGKHVLCEKPLANTVDEAAAMAAAADEARARGVRSMVGFSYRRVPAIALAARMIADGALGELRHVRSHYLQDWIADPEFPLVWRLQRERAGSGTLGDIGAHALDMVEHLSGQRITRVAGHLRTFVPRRRLAQTSHGLGASAEAGAEEWGDVTVDDAALVHAELDGGALAAVEATRFATGRKNAFSLELNGSGGSLAFDFEAMNELWYYDAGQGASAGFRRILVTEPDHPYAGAWWPPGHGLGYEHPFVHQCADLLQAIAEGADPEPSFADGLRVQRILAAVEASSADSSAWTAVPAAAPDHAH